MSNAVLYFSHRIPVLLLLSALFFFWSCRDAYTAFRHNDTGKFRREMVIVSGWVFCMAAMRVGRYMPLLFAILYRLGLRAGWEILHVLPLGLSMIGLAFLVLGNALNVAAAVRKHFTPKPAMPFPQGDLPQEGVWPPPPTNAEQST